MKNIMTPCLKGHQQFLLIEHLFQTMMITHFLGMRRQVVITDLPLHRSQWIINVNIMQSRRIEKSTIHKTTPFTFITQTANKINTQFLIPHPPETPNFQRFHHSFPIQINCVQTHNEVTLL